MLQKRIIKPAKVNKETHIDNEKEVEVASTEEENISTVEDNSNSNKRSYKRHGFVKKNERKKYVTKSIRFEESIYNDKIDKYLEENNMAFTDLIHDALSSHGVI